MNKEILKGKWNQLKGKATAQWGKLTDNELTETNGDFDKMVGLIQEKYGYEKEKAERQVNDFLDNHR